MELRRTACPHDCPATGSLLAAVEDGRVIHGEGEFARIARDEAPDEVAARLSAVAAADTV